MHLWPPATKPTMQTPRTTTTRRQGTTGGGTRLRFSVSSMISRRPQMPSVFNIVRACVYSAVLLWTVICLAIAIHFNQMLTSNDLTRFIPFAIFVCSATLAIFLALLLFGVRTLNPITTRIELGCLGLAGIIWLVLIAFLFSSSAANADVECYSAGSAAIIDVPGFSTATFQAQYRVIEASSVINVLLIWGFLLFLLFLALRYHSRGERQVWVTPVTIYPWFYRPQSQEKSGKASKLPPPVTAQVDRSKTKGAGALKEVKNKSSDRRARGRETSRGHQPERPTVQYAYKHGYWLPQAPPVPPKAGGDTGRRGGHDKYLRDASPRR